MVNPVNDHLTRNPLVIGFISIMPLFFSQNWQKERSKHISFIVNNS